MLAALKVLLLATFNIPCLTAWLVAILAPDVKAKAAAPPVCTVRYAKNKFIGSAIISIPMSLVASNISPQLFNSASFHTGLKKA